ncbi:MAG: sugar transferase [Candidatus Woykebacteria bacterium]
MWYFFIKRVLDITLSLVGLIVLSPLFLVVAAAIKLNSTGPVFADAPQRVGKHQKVFKMLKFRSMIKNAHLLLREDPQLKRFYESYKTSNFKIPTEKDPRITKVGRFLRQTSIDELPQLINVLRGEMSLVGPRAFHNDEIQEQLKNFPSSKQNVEKALSVRPGITGPWQVSGRSKIGFPERVRLDAEYAKNKSLLYDLALLVRTIPAVFRGEGN